MLCIDRAWPDAFRGDFCTSNRPFLFSVDLPEGDYDVTVTLGDQAGESTTTIKAPRPETIATTSNCRPACR
jgi:hypothetical protein